MVEAFVAESVVTNKLFIIPSVIVVVASVEVPVTVKLPLIT